MIELKDEDFEKLISKGLVLVDFNASWCGPCKMLKPNLEKLSKEDSIKIISIDVDKFPALAAKYGVMTIPNLYLFKNGEEIRHGTGYMTYEELNTWLDV